MAAGYSGNGPNGLVQTGPVMVSCHEDLDRLRGGEIISGEWVAIDQDMIDGFGRIIGDEQWIHTDEVMAAEGMFGRTIAHGDLILALTNKLLGSCIQFDGYVSLVRQRQEAHFMRPVHEGSRVGLMAHIFDVKQLRGGFEGYSSFTSGFKYLVDTPTQPPACKAEVSFLLQWAQDAL